jgi:hypothetical protein
MSDFALASYADTLAGLDDITTLLTDTAAPPEPAPFHPPEIVGETLNGAPIENGFESFEWGWDWLTWNDYGVLCGYVTGASSSVYAKTRKADYTPAYFLATAWRPTGEPKGSLVFNVKMKFTRAEEQSAPGP